MLAFVRGTHGARTECDLKQVIEHAVNLAHSEYDVTRNMDFKHIRVDAAYPPEMPPVRCCMTEMEQVVKSLKRSSSKHKFKIMVGGGAVTEQLAKNMGADAYTENCIEAVEVAKTFIE